MQSTIENRWHAQSHRHMGNHEQAAAATNQVTKMCNAQLPKAAIWKTRWNASCYLWIRTIAVRLTRTAMSKNDGCWWKHEKYFSCPTVQRKNANVAVNSAVYLKNLMTRIFWIDESRRKSTCLTSNNMILITESMAEIINADLGILMLSAGDKRNQPTLIRRGCLIDLRRAKTIGLDRLI